MNIEIQLTDDHLRVPEYQTKGSAGIDLPAAGISQEIVIFAGASRKIGTGIKLNMKDSGLVGLVFPRSSLGSRGLVIKNLTGVIDSDYQGEIILNVWNTNEEGFLTIKPFDRIAQLLFLPVVQVNLKQVDQFSDTTERGDGGFGSTGII